MAKVTGLEKSLKDKSKKEAEDLRFKFAKTEAQKKFLKDNPNVKTASEMKKKIANMKSGNFQSKMNPGGTGSYPAFRKGGSVKNTRRMNRLEELGRVDAEKAYTKKGKRNLKAEKKRIVRSLNSRGAAKRGHGAEIR